MIQVCGWLLGIPLQILVIAALLRGQYRRYPFVLLYTAAGFVITLVEIPLFTDSFRTGDAAVARHAARVYWVNEWILQVLVFSLVLSLIYQASATAPWRRGVRACLIAGAVVFAGISFSVHFSPELKYGYWMTPWTRDLNFGAAFLDLALWTMLLASANRDRRLLLVSGALGLQFTGEAIGHAIRELSVPQMVAPLSITGSVIAMFADLTCLYLWWQAFHRADQIRQE